MSYNVWFSDFKSRIFPEMWGFLICLYTNCYSLLISELLSKIMSSVFSVCRINDSGSALIVRMLWGIVKAKGWPQGFWLCSCRVRPRIFMFTNLQVKLMLLAWESVHCYSNFLSLIVWSAEQQVQPTLGT